MLVVRSWRRFVTGLRTHRGRRVDRGAEHERGKQGMVAGIVGAQARSDSMTHAWGTKAGEMTIDVRLLGAFRMSTDRGVLPQGMWHNGRAKALFQYLAFRAGTPVSRDALLDLLWPDWPSEETCLNSLHKAVHTLRSTINTALGWDGKDLLEFNGGYYTLHAAYWQVDALQFKQSIFEARWSERLKDAAGARRHYEEAVRLYRGDLLEDDYLMSWIIPERIRLRDAYCAALRTLGALYRAEGNDEKSAGCYRRLLMADHCAEDAYRALIEFAVASDQRGEALRLHREYRDTLRREVLPLHSNELDSLVAGL